MQSVFGISLFFLIICFACMVIWLEGKYVDHKCKAGFHFPYEFEGSVKCGRCGKKVE